MASSRLVLTARGAGGLVGALIVLLLAFYTINILLFAVAVFLLAFMLSALFAFVRATRGFGPDAFEAQRVESSSFVSVGGHAFVSVRVSSQLEGAFYTEIFDSHPERLAVLDGDTRLVTWWAGGEPLTLAYVVSPKMRGQFEIGPTVVVAHDSFGFAFKLATLRTSWKIEALPNPVSVTLGHPTRLSNLVVGQTSLFMRGAGSDFHALREYQPEDEPRNIAWSRSGKGTLYVREYDRESQQDLIVILDVGRPMAMGVAYEDALEKATEAASVLVRNSFDEDVRTGLLLYSDRVVRYLPPRRGSDHEFLVFRTLGAAQVEPPFSSFDVALTYLLPRLGRATSLIAFSSMGGKPDVIASAYGTLRRAGHRLYVLAPDVRGMYPDPTDPSHLAALRLVMGPEVLRAQGAAGSLRHLGIPVGFFGRTGALEAVHVLFSRVRAPQGAP
jgi:uncharacterized protein (DUF58 family)